MLRTFFLLPFLLGGACSTAIAETWRPPEVSAQEILVQLQNNPRIQTRPRLLIASFDELQHGGKTPEGRLLAERIEHDAELLLSEAPSKYQKTGIRLLDVSRTVLFRVNTLAVAWHLTGKKAYAERAVAEMMAVAAFPDWNPSHFLDVGEMTLALAVGYDWLYETMPAEERTTIREAILKHGLRVSVADPRAWWIHAANNWYAVCHGGLTAGAVAVWEEDPKLAAQVIARGLNGIAPYMKNSYFPCGAYPEGPGYWDYGTDFTSVWLAVLMRAFGQDFGISQAPGFAETGFYLKAVTGPSGKTFNYSDGGSGFPLGFSSFYLAYRYRRPDWRQPQADRNLMEYARRRPKNSRGQQRLLPLILPFLEVPQDREAVSPLNYFSGKDALVPIAVFRSGFDRDAVFLGVKGGAPNAPHGHMDGGSFVLEADGVRWAQDLGMENYHKIESRGMNLWSNARNSDRWRIFRIGFQSHNIPVIDDQPPRVDGRVEIIEVTDGEEYHGATLDLSKAYTGQAVSAIREARLLPDRSVVIRDRFTGLKPGAVVRWQMLTGADTVPDETGFRLTSGNRKCHLVVQTSALFRTRVVETSSLEQVFDTPNRDCRMLTVETVAPADGTVDWQFVFSFGD